MNQTSENGKKPSFEPDFYKNPSCHFFFFSKIWPHQSLDIMVSYQHVQHQKNILVKDIQTDRHMDGQTDGQVIS